MIAPEPADGAFGAAFLVCTLNARLTVERLDVEVGPESDPAIGFYPLTGEPDDLCDRGFEVVISDLANGEPQGQ